LAALFFSATYVATVEAGGQDRESPRPVPRVAWATYWGAGGANNRTVSVDRSGNVYMCGGTNSRNWPTTTGVRHAGGSDITIAKFDPAGNLVWSTLIGGPSGKLVVGGGNSTSADLPTDRGTCAGPVLKPKRGGAKDSWVAVCVTGETQSKDFPLMNPVQKTPAGAFLARFVLPRNGMRR
jgi:hypothetical protein